MCLSDFRFTSKVTLLINQLIFCTLLFSLINTISGMGDIFKEQVSWLFEHVSYTRSKKKKSITLCFTSCTSVTFAVFPDEWYFQLGAFFKYFPASKTWIQAKAFCRNIDADLAFISDSDLNEFVFRNLLPPARKENGMFVTMHLIHYVQLQTVCNFEYLQYSAGVVIFTHFQHILFCSWANSVQRNCQDSSVLS